MKKNMAKAYVITLLAIILTSAVIILPGFGSFQNKHVAEYYIDNGAIDTGSANLVNSIVWDYRGYDTLGEETVLFIAALGVLLVIGRKHG